MVIRRSGRSIASLLFMLLPIALPALDWESFAESSSSVQDTVLLSAMGEGDLETALEICRGVSRRADPSMAAIIEALADSHTGSAFWRNELLIRTLLQPVAAAETEAEFRKARASANAGILDDLFARIGDWSDPQLAGVLVRIAPLSASPQALQAVAYIGTRIVHWLQNGKGLIPSQEAGLALDYLDSAIALGRGELGAQCAEIARLSRDAVIVKAARTAAMTLLTLP
jgi:hypothetical protein